MVEKTLPLYSETPDPLARRRFILICITFALLCLALKPMTWFSPRAEVDEQVYWTVARHFLRTGHYTLQGTGAIEALNLPRHIYDRPLFHHPPLFPAALLPFAAANRPDAAIVISWLGHVLGIVGIGLVCWAWRDPSWRGTELALWLPVLAIAVDPLMMFCSRKLWIDGMVGGLDALALGMTVLALERRRISWAVAAGVVFGLAGLTKLTGVLPVIQALIYAFVVMRNRPNRFAMCLALVGPVVVLVAPWLMLFRLKCGVWLPAWVAPTAESIAASPHVARAVERSWHYYIVQSVLIAPVSLACAIRLFRKGRGGLSARATLGWATVAIVVVTHILLGIRGMGMQMRYLTPGVGGLYVLLAAQLSSIDVRRSVFPAIVLACVAFGCIQTGFYLQAIEFDEIVSLPEMAWRAITSTQVNRGVGG